VGNIFLGQLIGIDKSNSSIIIALKL